MESLTRSQALENAQRACPDADVITIDIIETTKPFQQPSFDLCVRIFNENNDTCVEDAFLQYPWNWAADGVQGDEFEGMAFLDHVYWARNEVAA
jgi:hypothetical protein